MTSDSRPEVLDNSIFWVKYALSQNIFKPEEKDRKSIVEAIETKLVSLENPFLFELKQKEASSYKKDIKDEETSRKVSLEDLGSFAVENGAIGLIVSLTCGFDSLSVFKKEWKCPLILDCPIIDVAQLGLGDGVIISSGLSIKLGLDLGEFIDEAHSYGQEVILEVCSKEEFKLSKNTEADIILVRVAGDKSNSIQDSITILGSDTTSRPVLAYCTSLSSITPALSAGARGIIIGDLVEQLQTHGITEFIKILETLKKARVEKHAKRI